MSAREESFVQYFWCVNNVLWSVKSPISNPLNMAEELLVSLNKRDPSCGLGFSLLGTPGFPPVIYDIAENSPAAESGQVSSFMVHVMNSCAM